jgi:hypothetical protein
MVDPPSNSSWRLPKVASRRAAAGGRLRLGRRLGQTDTKRIQRLIQRFISGSRQAGVDSVPKQLPNGQNIHLRIKSMSCHE